MTRLLSDRHATHQFFLNGEANPTTWGLSDHDDGGISPPTSFPLVMFPAKISLS